MPQRSTDIELRRALANLAAEDLPALFEEARAEARRRVRGLLADALTEEMLDQAKAQTPPEPPPRREASAREAGFGYYVYCVVRADTQIPSSLPGIATEHSPTALADGSLAAVVSRVPLADFEEERLRERLGDMEWLERAARTHEQVLEAVARESTLIPMRLCSVYRNEAGVLEMLEREAPALEEALEHLRGKQEWGVKVFAPAPGAASTVEVDDASGTDYMRRRQGERQRRNEAADRLYALGRSIHERLERVASDAVVSPPQRPEVTGHDGQMLLNGVYLVEDADRESFLELVQLIQQEHEGDGLELQPTGPWPAYNFVPGTIGAAW